MRSPGALAMLGIWWNQHGTRGPRIMSQRTDELDQVDVRILRGFARGALSKTVATELDLPLRTVERRMSSIRERLGAPNTVAAVVIAVRRGYI